MDTTIEFTKIKHDVNGNPRYVCHWLNFMTDSELDILKNKEIYGWKGYEIAIKRANKIGGRKFHNKQYGGGIVFQSYNIRDTEQAILEIVAKESDTESTN